MLDNFWKTSSAWTLDPPPFLVRPSDLNCHLKIFFFFYFSRFLLQYSFISISIFIFLPPKVQPRFFDERWICHRPTYWKKLDWTIGEAWRLKMQDSDDNYFAEKQFRFLCENHFIHLFCFNTDLTDTHQKGQQHFWTTV